MTSTMICTDVANSTVMERSLLTFDWAIPALVALARLNPGVKLMIEALGDGPANGKILRSPPLAPLGTTVTFSATAVPTLNGKPQSDAPPCACPFATRESVTYSEIV